MTTDYRWIFAVTYGDFPHPCHFCREPVLTLGKRSHEGAIHHLDGNHSNNAPENLVMTHTRCHLSHHHAGRSHTEETRAKVSAAGVARFARPEEREAQSKRIREQYADGRRVKTGGPEKGYTYEKRICPDCGRETSVSKSGRLFRHVCADGQPIHSEATRAAMSASHTGKTHTDAHRAAVSAAVSESWKRRQEQS